MKKKPDKKKEARRAMLEKADKEDAAQFKDKADRLMDLAFPTKREEVKKAKQGRYHLLKGGSEMAGKFEKRWPELFGVNAPNPDGSRERVLLRTFAGKEFPFGYMAGLGGHEAGHDIVEEHEPPPGLMQNEATSITEGEDTFETALRQALESGGRALDEEHMTQNADPFDAVRKALGYPTAAETLPSKAHKLDNMLEDNPPAERYEWQSSAWEDDK